MPVIMLTATKTVKTAVDAMKLGAFDYVTKPFDVEELRIIVERATENAALQREVEELRWEVGRRYSSEQHHRPLAAHAGGLPHHRDRSRRSRRRS